MRQRLSRYGSACHSIQSQRRDLWCKDSTFSVASIRRHATRQSSSRQGCDKIQGLGQRGWKKALASERYRSGTGGKYSLADLGWGRYDVWPATSGLLLSHASKGAQTGVALGPEPKESRRQGDCRGPVRDRAAKDENHEPV